VIGEFTWTGWDYLGEVGIGRVEYGEPTGLGMTGFHGAYPWRTAWCGDIDIAGHRRPQSHYREIVFGLRTEPHVAVHPPDRHGQTLAHSSPWSFDDVVASWDWPDHVDQPVVVDVYADADEVELVVAGTSLGRQPAGAEHGYRARFETTYRPGTVEAVAWRGGEEVGRASLASPSGDVGLALQVDRPDVTAAADDLAFVEVTLVDGAGSVWTSTDRVVAVELDGPATLQGLASANPVSEEPFAGSSCTTFQGRAIAVVRPHGPGTITLTATAEGIPPQQTSIRANEATTQAR
jgi:beta-galactosidase